jgi:hypothetical protein
LAAKPLLVSIQHEAEHQLAAGVNDLYVHCL